ncbi:histidine phosphatase family protein [Nocardiopsis sp. RV163]|uniref:histidine phosphatase family protein n=1 Tax=Nocardiopsis sp. RV163 TaxID=1661388 RepID=UPI00064C1707|nr:histidine phosphatase family protein [Nocardiopsis sp. RV163]
MPATRHLYLARHAEAEHENGSLTEKGRHQAASLGRRLRHAGVDRLHHGPLARTTQTARLAARELGTTPVRVPEAGDYAPHLPLRAELPQEHADGVLGFVASLPEHERLSGPAMARRALKRFTGPVEGEHERHEAVITHAYLVAWIVCVALDAPVWRWTTLAPANAALTVLRYSPGRPASVLAFNDTAHLD